MATNKHLFIINPWNSNTGFKRTRGRERPEENANEENDEQEKVIADFQKERLRLEIGTLFRQRALRNRLKNERYRALGTIDLIRIHFFGRFDDPLAAKFLTRYGLSAVEYMHFNKTVLFEVINQKHFKDFFDHIDMIVRSPAGTSYAGKPYNLIALIYSFEFIGEHRRQHTGETLGIVLTLTASANREIYSRQFSGLTSFLRENNATISYNESVPDLIQVAETNRTTLRLIAQNFDIVKSITSSRGMRVRPGTYGEVQRDHGFTVSATDNLPTVAIIDTGISSNTPFRNCVLPQHYDQSGFGAFWDESGHGTAVAGLVILGDDFIQNNGATYQAKANVMAIKVLHEDDGALNIPKTIQDIKNAHHTYGIRLFNMSINIPLPKQYNSGYSTFAYELDKLAYENDLLIFLSVGNIPASYLEECLGQDYHPEHDYPIFFYKPEGATSPVHRCSNTNICEPAESLNNLSIGALAGNFGTSVHLGISPDSLYPAYYTRKFHIDYLQRINSTTLSVNQRNKYLNKPDLVFEGGDLFEESAGLELVQAPTHTNPYFKRSCGTSFAAPLTASYAAELVGLYPTLKMQTIKALIINAATYPKKTNLPAFTDSSNDLLKSMVGFGKPQKSQLLSTEDDSIVFVVEERIKPGQLLKMPVELPAFLRQTDTKLKFEITMCYSFLPVKDNHLNYLPLHISFNLVRNINISTLATADQNVYGIKSTFSWSEDHYGLENRLFSNAQSCSYSLQSDDIKNIKEGVAIAVRCLIKDQVPANYKTAMRGKQHSFSLVIRITELPGSKASGRLYNEMATVNTVRNIANVTGTLDVDLDA